VKYSSTPKTTRGYIVHNILPAFILLMLPLALAVIHFNKRGFVDQKNCQALAESVKYLSRTRADRFVMDASSLRAFLETNQPMSFWFRRIVEESSLVEAVDYVVFEDDGRKRALLTIEAVYGIAAKTVESDGGFFQSPETRNARRLLECLHEPYFQEIFQEIIENAR